MIKKTTFWLQLKRTKNKQDIDLQTNKKIINHENITSIFIEFITLPNACEPLMP